MGQEGRVSVAIGSAAHAFHYPLLIQSLGPGCFATIEAYRISA